GEGPPPAIIQKRDGAFTYTTTDLATIQYRMDNWKPDVILYVVGTPQAFHFNSLFSIARRWGYDKIALEHIAFGSVLGEDRKMLRTREGEQIALESLLDEATGKALKVVVDNADREPTVDETIMGPDGMQKIAKVVGYGAVKYADLCQNRTTDYVFSWDKML